MVLEAYGGRLAIEATMEPPVTVSRNQRSKIPDEREKGASQSTAENGGKISPRIRYLLAYRGI